MKEKFPTFKANPRAVMFDGPGGTQVPETVINAMTDYIKNDAANVGGHFKTSLNTSVMVHQIRKQVGGFFNAPNYRDIFFDQNATSIIFKLSRAICRDLKEGDKILVTKLDHCANVSPWIEIAKDKKLEIEFLDFDTEYGGLLRRSFPKEKLKEAKLVAFTLSSNCTGVITKKAKEIIAKCKANDCLTFVDAVHYAAHHPIDITDLAPDFLVCSGYKFYGPHIGIGYANVETSHEIRPYSVASVDNIAPGKWETGTLNFEALAGLGEAIKFIEGIGWEEFESHENELMTYFLYKSIRATHKITIYGTTDIKYKAGTYCLSVDGFNSHDLSHILSAEGIYTWAGDFYAKWIPEEYNVKSFLRIGFSIYNSKEDIDTFFNVLNALEKRNEK